MHNLLSSLLCLACFVGMAVAFRDDSYVAGVGIGVAIGVQFINVMQDVTRYRNQRRNT